MKILFNFLVCKLYLSEALDLSSFGHLFYLKSQSFAPVERKEESVALVGVLVIKNYEGCHLRYKKRKCM